MIHIIISLIILIIALSTFAFFLIIKFSQQNSQILLNYSRQELTEKGFDINKIFFINRFLMLIFNKKLTKFALVQNYNPDFPNKYTIQEISANLITEIQKDNFHIKIKYLAYEGTRELIIKTFSNKKIFEYFHKILLENRFKKIKSQYPNIDFKYFSASDWQCSYVFAYSDITNTLAYLDIKNNKISKTNLLKSVFIIDTKYKYFETSIFNIIQQISAYSENFFDEIYSSLKKNIKNVSTEILNNKIYYNVDDNFIYISNGTNSLEGIDINLIENNEYQQNKLSFNFKNSNRTINFLCDNKLIEEFKKFVLEYNLKKIANKFNYNFDKLINTTSNTKFIIDSSRQRYIYCANLYSLSNSRKIIISFSNVISAEANKSGQSNFVRLELTNNETIDISCDKQEVATYIMAQIKLNIENS